MADFTLPVVRKAEGLHPTAIEWTDYSANPLRAVTRDGQTGWACVKVSPGCANCYAEAINLRFGTKQPFTAKGMEDVRVVLDEQRLAAMLAAKPRGSFRAPDGRPKVFIGDMTDVCGAWVPDETLDRLFAVFALRPDIDWQVLTKRPERMAEYLNSDRRPHAIAKAADTIEVELAIDALQEEVRDVPGFPGYRVSNMGLVFGPRVRLEPQAGKQGHARVTLYLEGNKHRVLVHRLVLSVFDRPPQPGEQACHKNGDPSCNAMPNLSWGSQSTNWADRRRHGEHRSYSKLTPDGVAAVRAALLDDTPAERIAVSAGVSATQIRNIARGDQWSTGSPIPWPIPGVWLGTSCEDQRRADERIPHLLRCPAAVRFLSCEPLLGAIRLAADFGPKVIGESTIFHPRINWVVVGGESGHKPRPCNVDWIRGVVRQCAEARVPCFVKQDSGPRAGMQRRIPDDLWVKEWPHGSKV